LKFWERGRPARTVRRPAEQIERTLDPIVWFDDCASDAIGETPMAATETVALPSLAHRATIHLIQPLQG
jgi:hypothetical protein